MSPDSRYLLAVALKAFFDERNNGLIAALGVEIFNRYSLDSKFVKHKSLKNLRGGQSCLIQEEGYDFMLPM